MTAFRNIENAARIAVEIMLPFKSKVGYELAYTNFHKGCG